MIATRSDRFISSEGVKSSLPCCWWFTFEPLLVLKLPLASCRFAEVLVPRLVPELSIRMVSLPSVADRDSAVIWSRTAKYTCVVFDSSVWSPPFGHDSLIWPRLWK